MAIIRDYLGTPLAAACGGAVPSTVVAHELQGAELGLKLENFKRFRRIHISTDSVTVFHLFSDKNVVPDWSVRHVWIRIGHLRKLFERVRFSHVYKETNRAADLLADIHPAESFVEVDPSRFDSILRKIVEEDGSRKVYHR